MIFLTAGDAKFRKYIDITLRRAAELGYEVVVYDLGGLGLGTPHLIDSPEFHTTGYYSPIPGTLKKTKALHKPDLVKRCMTERSELIVYLDGDAVLDQPIPEIVGDYDVGVTVREPWEVEHFATFQDTFKKMALGYINAGVIFFNTTDRARDFVECWRAMTLECGNDQYALNCLTAPWGDGRQAPAVGSTRTLEGIRVRYFPTTEYNNIYLSGDFADREEAKRTRIYHFRGGRSREAFERIALRWSTGEPPRGDT